MFGSNPYAFGQGAQYPGGPFSLGQLPAYDPNAQGAPLSLGDPQQQQQQHHHGMNPLMMLSPLLGAFMSGHPNIGLGMISPALGISRALGLFK